MRVSMRLRHLIIPFVAVLLALAACSPSAQEPAATAACDRECLDGLVDQYLDALVAHDPSRLPLAESVKF